MQMLRETVDRIRKTGDIDRESLAFLLKTGDTDLIRYLKECARLTADEVYGKRVYIRGLIEFTNYCKNDCKYCGIRNLILL